MSDRFAASIRRYHQQIMSNVMGRLQAGSVFALTPQEFTALSDLAGALNYWAAQTPETPVVITPEVMQPDVRYVFTASAGHVTAIPFTIPAGSGMFSGTAAEYVSGGTALAHAAINREAGDLTGATGGGSAIEVWRDARTDGAGLWYYNIQLDFGSADRGTGFSWRVVA